MAGTSGSAYRVVTVSWNSRWKIAYGTKATMIARSARRPRQSSTAAPAAASSTMKPPALAQ